jgi:hypothetical protein
MKRRDILIIFISLFFCALAWIGFSIYHSAVTPTISEEANIQIAPISPNLNTKVVDELKGRDQIEPFFLNIISITPRSIQNSSRSAQTVGGKIK